MKCQGFIKVRVLMSVFALFVAVASGQVQASEFKIALVLDKGGKDDKSFNAAAYRGVMEAKEKLSAQVKFVEATDDNAFEPLLRAFAKKKYDLIIAIGIAQADALNKVAPQFPEQKFAIVDAPVNADNVRTLLFEEHEGSYLVGAIAALTSKTGKVGFIGGMDIPLIRRFELGFVSGALKINPKIRFVSNFVGITGDAWNNPAKAKELAIAQYSGGADVIFAAAGGSGAGLFDAAEEKKKWAIGVDSNQNWIKPGLILTSMLKRVDTAVYSVIKEVAENPENFKGGITRYGLGNSGVDYAVDEHNEKLMPASLRTRVDGLKAEIVSGKLIVPDYYNKKKAK